MTDAAIIERLHDQVHAEELRTIWLAGGCFWGTEAYFKKIPGVVDTEVGYANGRSDQPRYETLKESGHAETVKIVYDANRVSLFELLLHYLRTIDPFSVNRQGNDIGTQYRTGIYFEPNDERSERVAKRLIEEKEKEYGRKTAIEILPLEGFGDAESYHQNYLDNNPMGYCHVNLNLANQPLFEEENRRYRKLSEEEARQSLTHAEFEVTQHAATEAPFSHPYDHEFRPGIYVDRVTGEPLFVSTHKYDSGCGWPAFSRPISESRIEYVEDFSHGMHRVEVKSAYGQSHLGHVFTDGIKEQGGLRYCINGSALRFIPEEDLEKEGYGIYRALVEENR